MLDLVSVMVFGEVTIATGVCVALVRVTTCGVFWSPSFATAAGGEGLWTIGDGGGAIGLRPAFTQTHSHVLQGSSIWRELLHASLFGNLSR